MQSDPELVKIIVHQLMVQLFKQRTYTSFVNLVNNICALSLCQGSISDSKIILCQAIHAHRSQCPHLS